MACYTIPFQQTSTSPGKQTPGAARPEAYSRPWTRHGGCHESTATTAAMTATTRATAWLQVAAALTSRHTSVPAGQQASMTILSCWQNVTFVWRTRCRKQCKVFRTCGTRVMLDEEVDGGLQEGPKPVRLLGPLDDEEHPVVLFCCGHRSWLVQTPARAVKGSDTRPSRKSSERPSFIATPAVATWQQGQRQARHTEHRKQEHITCPRAQLTADSCRADVADTCACGTRVYSHSSQAHELRRDACLHTRKV